MANRGAMGFHDSVRYERQDLFSIVRAQTGVCSICFQGCDGTICRSCEIWKKSAMGSTASKDTALLPISLRAKGRALWSDTWAYKDSDDAAKRDLAARRLAWLVHNFTTRHEACIAKRLRVPRFDVVVPIPSSKERPGVHPLSALLRQVPNVAGRVREVLVHAGGAESAHRPDPNRFATRGGTSLRGANVLLIDDTLTTGANVFSALHVLRKQGAEVGALVIGRHFDPEYSAATRRYFASASQVPFDFGVCALCDRRPMSRVN